MPSDECIDRLDCRLRAKMGERPCKASRCRQLFEDPERGRSCRDHASVWKDEPDRCVAFFVGDALEQRIGRDVVEPEEREAFAPV